MDEKEVNEVSAPQEVCDSDTKAKPADKKAKAKARRRKAGKVILCILALIVLFVVITVIISFVGNRANMKKASSFAPVEYENQIQPVKNADGIYEFVTDGDFKVVQLTDVHIGGGWMSLKKDAMALNTVAAMLAAEKPDLVVATGDVAYPVPFQAGTFNNKTSAKMFAELMETLGVYWTIGFGNHDTEAYSFYSREKISDFYAADGYPHCVFTANPAGVEIDGWGNQVINVKKTDGSVTQSIYVLDTGSYVDNDYLGALWKYDTIHQNQVDWYKSSVEAVNKANAELGAPEAKSIAFFHIPLEEYRDGWAEYINNGEKDTADTKFIYGKAGESKKVIYCGLYDSEFFETAKQLGSTQAMFCGHDHYNNFSIDYKGIRLTYGMSVDYLAYPGIYKLGTQRGCTVIGISPDGELEITAKNYYDEANGYISQYEKEAVTMQTVENQTYIATDYE